MSILKSITGIFKNENKNQTLESIIPYTSIENDLIVMKTGRVAMGFLFDGVEMEQWTESDFRQAGQVFDSSLKSLPTGSIIQKIDIYYNDFISKEKELSFFETNAINHFLGRPILKHKSYFFIISPTDRDSKPNEINNTFASFDKINIKETLKNIERRLSDWKKQGPSYIQELSTINDAKFIRLNTEELKELYRQMLNLEFRFDPGPPYKTMLNTDNYLVVGDKKVNVISLTEQSKNIDYSRDNGYGVVSPFTYNIGIYLQVPHINVTSYYIEDTEKQLQSLDKERRLNFAATQFGGEDPKIKDEEIGIMTEDIRTNQKRLVSMSKQVIIYTLGEQARERNITETIAQIRTWDSAEGFVETYYNMGMFWACLPGNASETVRWITMPSDVATAYCDFTTSYNGGNSGDIMCDRFGNLIYVQLYNTDLVNQNSIVQGLSGSGKSFLIGHLIMMAFGRKEIQYIIDVGGTYKNLFETLGCDRPNSGVKYFEYNPENPISFNPFYASFENGRFVINEDKIDFIITLFTQIWTGHDLKKSIKAIFSEWLELYFVFAGKQRAKNEAYIPMLVHFYDWLIKYNEANANNPAHLSRLIAFNNRDLMDGFNDFLIVLNTYCYGKYKKLLNSEDNIDLSDYKLVCFDLARVKENKELYPLVTMLLSELTMDIVRKFPDEIKNFRMDEAWQMLQEGMGEFVQYLYRTLRKNKGAMQIITQGVEEIIQSSVGMAIINNADTKIILKQENDTQIEQLAKYFGFTTEEKMKIGSIRHNKHSREVFIKQGNQSDVFSLEVCDSEHAILTSKPSERNRLNRLKQHYATLDGALNEWVEEKNKGLFN